MINSAKIFPVDVDASEATDVNPDTGGADSEIDENEDDEGDSEADVLNFPKKKKTA